MHWIWLAVALALTEIPYDGIDQDGDGIDLIDADRDGYASTLALGPDCNDRDPTVNPGTWDWAGDGVDGDCDGLDGHSDRASAAQFASLAWSLRGPVGLTTALLWWFQMWWPRVWSRLRLPAKKSSSRLGSLHDR